MKTTHNQAGNFSIILLLVIAALSIGAIGYMVFMKQADEPTVTPSVTVATTETDQAVETDDAVMQAVQTIAGNLEEYAADHNGKYPALSGEIQEFSRKYVSSTLVHPVNKKPYALDAATPKNNELLYQHHAACKADGKMSTVEASRRFALQAKLVSGSLYCVDNS